MRARIGDLAIVKFDGVGTKYDERVGLVTGCYVIHLSSGAKSIREHAFIYWGKAGKRTTLMRSELPSSRLVRARPKKKWNGELSTLTIDDVVPVQED